MPLTVPPSDPRRLQRSVTLASWWLMGQGLLYVVAGSRITDALYLRYHDNMVPYMNTGGLALMALGLFVNRAVREASRQYLAVDTLVLYFLGQAILTLYQRGQGYPVFWFEWLAAAVSVSLAGALVLFRTRGSQMEAPGSLVAMDVMVALQQPSALLKKASPPAIGGAPAAADPSGAAGKSRGSSQAMPHMD